jgi:hypothetical protein
MRKKGIPEPPQPDEREAFILYIRETTDKPAAIVIMRMRGTLEAKVILHE